jgi:hypothetical protein
MKHGQGATMGQPGLANEAVYAGKVPLPHEISQQDKGQKRHGIFQDKGLQDEVPINATPLARR